MMRINDYVRSAVWLHFCMLWQDNNQRTQVTYVFTTSKQFYLTVTVIKCIFIVSTFYLQYVKLEYWQRQCPSDTYARVNTADDIHTT